MSFIAKMKNLKQNIKRFFSAPLIKYRSLPRILSLYLILVTILSVSVLAFFWIFQASRKSTVESDNLRHEYIENQKARIAQEVISVRGYILYMRSQSEKSIRKNLQERVEDGYKIAMNIYQENKDISKNEEIIENIKQALSPVLFNDNRCYYILTSLNGVQLMNPKYLSSDGSNRLNYRDKEGNYIIKSELNLLNRQNEGFITYRKASENDGDSGIFKITYVKKIAQLGCYIASTDNIEHAKRIIQNEVLNRISSIRFGKEGYIFVNTYEGMALIKNGELMNPPVDINAGTDENWKSIFAQELEAAKKPEGDYYTYKFRKLSESRTSTKISYFLGVPEWNWIIGSGLYIDDVEPVITQKKAELGKQIRMDILRVMAFLFVILLIILLIARYISKRTGASLNYLTQFFHRARTEYHAIDPHLLYFDEFQTIAFSANEMVAEREKVKQALETEKSLLRYLIDSIPDLVFFKDKKGVFLGCNKAFEEYTGRTEQEFKGKTEYDFFSTEQADQYSKTDAEILKTKESKRNFEWATYPDGRKVLLDTLKTLFFDSNGNSLGFIGISRDVTAIHETQQKLTLAKERAEESDKLKTAFLANMSHEIRTPMNAIIGFSDLLTDDNLSASDKSEYTTHIKKAGESLMNLISDIIDIAKIEAGQLQFNNSACNLDELLNEMIGTYTEAKIKAGKKNLNIRLHKQSGINGLSILTDPFRLKQVLINLIGNSMKFTERGFIEFGYSLKDKKTIEFVVRDTGIGIPLSKQQDIFYRFSQVDNSNTRKYGGTGLGLAISKNIIEIMGGTIWLESEPGNGSAFFFTLPYYPADTEENVNIIPGANQENVNWQGKTILVSEDVPSNFMFIEAALRRTKVRLLWAQDGRQAVTMAIDDPQIDLVLMDIQMPELNGYEATSEILKVRPDLPVISQTAYALSGEKEKSLAAGCVDYIPKPIKSDLLISTIGKYLFAEIPAKLEE
jgi:PAS domain S-box-containing protein